VQLPHLLVVPSTIVQAHPLKVEETSLHPGLILFSVEFSFINEELTTPVESTILEHQTHLPELS